MKITTLQWNIGGGTLLRPDVTVAASGLRDQTGMAAIISLIRKYNPDVITLQETHAGNGHSQSETIAKALGFANWVNDEYADSHIEPGQRLGQGIVSRWPIKRHDFAWFVNPHLQMKWVDGSIAHSHDKGRTRVELDLGSGNLVGVQTSHSLPFRKYGLGLEDAITREILTDMATKFTPAESAQTVAELIQSDCNINTESLRPLLPALFTHAFEEVLQHEPTNVKGRRYDHIVFRDLRLVSSATIVKGNDHYPIVSVFELDT